MFKQGLSKLVDLFTSALMSCICLVTSARWDVSSVCTVNLDVRNSRGQMPSAFAGNVINVIPCPFSRSRRVTVWHECLRLEPLVVG